jgi:steroid delta-isomerase-like uncharacterized protein
MRARSRLTLACGISLLLAATFMLGACAQPPDTSALDTEHARLADNKATTQRLFDEVINQGNMAVIDELLTPDMVDHEPGPPGMPPGREGVHQFFTMMHQAFPDLHVAVDQMVAEGDFVVVMSTWSGTQSGEFMGVPASGNPVTWQVWDMVRIVDGQVTEHWGLTDMMSLMMGMGALPMPPGMTP